MNLRWMPANDRVFTMAIGTSIVLHGLVLGIHFKFPVASRPQSSEQRMEVVLVNAKTRERPTRADVLAQSNLDRGGNVDERRRARSPLPVTEPKNPGKDLAAAQRRMRELEAQQQRLFAPTRESATHVPKETVRPMPTDEPAAQPSGRGLPHLPLA